MARKTRAKSSKKPQPKAQKRKQQPARKRSNGGGNGQLLAILGTLLKQGFHLFNSGSLPFSTSGSSVPLMGGGQVGGRSIPGGGGSLALTAPIANAFLSKSGVPRIRQKSAQSITITHREYVRKVRSRSDKDWGIDFIQQINPGNSSLFTYLSRFAGLYEGFKFRKLNFIYEPSTSTTTETGVYFAVDYDPADSNVITKDQLTSMPGSVKTVAWFQLIFNALGMNLNRQKLYNQVGNKELVTNEDIRLNSAGKFYIATENETDVGKALGDLYVEYEVELLIPQLSGDINPSTVLVSESAPVQVSPTVSQLFGSSGNYKAYGKLGCDLTYGTTHLTGRTSHQVRIPRPGNYLMVVKVAGSASGVAFNNGVVFNASSNSPSLIIDPVLENGSPSNFGFIFDTADGAGAFVAVRAIRTFSPESRVNLSFAGWSSINASNRAIVYITYLDESTFDEVPSEAPVPTVVSLLSGGMAPRKGRFIRDYVEPPVRKVKILPDEPENDDCSSDDEESFLPLRRTDSDIIKKREQDLYLAARECKDPETLDHLISLLSALRLKNFGSASERSSSSTNTAHVQTYSSLDIKN